MRQSIKRFLGFVAVLLASASTVYAQASITGVVRDSSGGVLPGVTVEAASAALIEKVRTATSDGGGQFRIVDLRPGEYVVTFSLAGFNTVRRDGLTLTGSFTAVINVDMRVGALEETVTVTGEAPTVDIQATTTQRVVNRAVIDAIPTGQYYTQMAALIPGATLTSRGGISQDVGGLSGDSQTLVAIHGGKIEDQKPMLNGVEMTSSTGNSMAIGPNMSQMEEVAIDTSAVDASQGTGGVRINFIPRDGGNTFRGNVFLSGAGEGMQADNLTDKLKSRGLTAVNHTKRVFDTQGGLGGPVRRDRLWFYFNSRYNLVQNYIAGVYGNAALADPNAWHYIPDLSDPSYGETEVKAVGLRLTYQATANHKFAVSWDSRQRCACPQFTTQATSLESGVNNKFNPSDVGNVSWTATMTNRLLMEAGAVLVHEGWGNRPSEYAVTERIGVVDNAPPAVAQGVTTYRGRTGNYTRTTNPGWRTRFSTSYVTGAHAMKAGFNENWGIADTENFTYHPYSYTFTNGVPTSISLNSNPVLSRGRMKSDFGMFIQDRWTTGRLTLNGGLRFDYVNVVSPDVTFGPAPLLPNRNFYYPETQLQEYTDLSPRFGMVYDLFGDGKTAVKVTLNRYVANVSLGTGGPGSQVVTTATRSWTDGNRNYVPDCDLVNPALQDNRAAGGDLCGAFTGNNVNFGKEVLGTILDPDTQFGWGVRGFNWEFSTGIQRELLPRVQVDFSYFRRWYGNFLVTDNFAVVASDYSPFSVKAPLNPELPDGGGYTVSGYMNVNPNVASIATNNHQRPAGDYGKQIEHWNGVDLTTNIRLSRGALIQGGLSTGRTLTDNCDVLTKVPESNPLGVPFCRQETDFLTQIKLIGSYTLPRIDVQASVAFQSIPGPALQANYVATNAEVQPSLGRPLAGNAANVTVGLIDPGTMYGDRVQQVDLRFGKILRFGGRRTTFSVDIYNALNSDAVLAESSVYTVFRRPSIVLPGRIFKLTGQFDF